MKGGMEGKNEGRERKEEELRKWYGEGKQKIGCLHFQSKVYICNPNTTTISATLISK
jgi:hypothetical protein